MAVLSRRRLPNTSKEFKVGGRWMRASKHIDCARREEEPEDANKLISRGVAIEGFFIIIGSISSDVTTGWFANLVNRGLRT